MIKKGLRFLILFFLSFILLIFLVLTNLQFVVFNRDFYVREYEKYSIVEHTGIKKSQLLSSTYRLLNYLKGKAEDPQSIATVNGKIRPLFGNRELLHLNDVRELFMKGFLIRNISFILLGLVLILIMLVKPIRLQGYSLMMSSPAAALVILLGAGLLIFLSFNTSFIYFHKIFFDNDLWLLDPSREYLIRMFPEGFFLDSALRVFVYTVVELSVLIVVFKVCKCFGRRSSY